MSRFKPDAANRLQEMVAAVSVIVEGLGTDLAAEVTVVVHFRASRRPPGPSSLGARRFVSIP